VTDPSGARQGMANWRVILALQDPHRDATTVIEIEYIVRDRRGVERLRTTDKKAAEAYDRILENAERLADWLRAGSVLPSLPDDDLETLTVHLARHARAS
jgi:uncharacterized protein